MRPLTDETFAPFDASSSKPVAIFEARAPAELIGGLTQFFSLQLSGDASAPTSSLGEDLGPARVYANRSHVPIEQDRCQMFLHVSC